MISDLSSAHQALYVLGGVLRVKQDHMSRVYESVCCIQAQGQPMIGNIFE